ncbi:MAG: hypothetical protein ONB48_09635 [candidate division KSB1 bacterium]|nr:hypothetical protein [candidate division KSB1 bacterium]MDZ7273748.1 hypothetical protein [candidate division KSB1 bacterium]MDZ7285904.1 hypothetical protein [candidate division KSB1 bacterium]MDZ7298936.1 hypothetical protein [candidate division KSB1 bacterium]MDZ7307611.1 hypothetical protein [candidate division KSB1 bacterium]
MMSFHGGAMLKNRPVTSARPAAPLMPPVLRARGALRVPTPRCFLPVIVALLLCLPAAGRAQPSKYFHTIHSNALALQYGRTAKLTYANQMSRRQQFKLFALYIGDKFDLGRDQVRSKVYNVNLQLQYHLLHLQRLFVNGSLGGGAYHLRARNSLDQKHTETKINFAGGLQGELFIQGSRLALVFDYDVLYLRFSGLYEFVHIPTVGLALVF